MLPIFQSYLDETYSYKYTNWPDVVSSQVQALREGLNCITLVHLLVERLFGEKLPKSLRSIELYQDVNYFDLVTNIDDVNLGDIIFVGKDGQKERLENFIPEYDNSGFLLNEPDLPKIHLALYTGEGNTGDPLFIHANGVDKKVSLWPLSKFKDYERYSTIYAIKRLKQELKKITN